jgi:hypothetical protein
MQDVQSHIEKVRYDAMQQYSNFAGDDYNSINLMKMKKNFANQSQGLITSYNANNLRAGVVNNGNFVNDDNFVSDNGNYKNATGWLADLVDVAKFGVTNWSADKERQLKEKQAEAAQAVSASEIEKLKLEISKLEAEKDASTSKDKSGSSATVKIIAVTGAFIIVGIATYFIFKKKKIN